MKNPERFVAIDSGAPHRGCSPIGRTRALRELGSFDLENARQVDLGMRRGAEEFRKVHEVLVLRHRLPNQVLVLGPEWDRLGRLLVVVRLVA